MKRHKRIPTFPAELIRTQTSVSHSKINYKCPQSPLLFSLTTVSGTGRFSGRKNVAKRLFFGCIFKIYLFSLFFLFIQFTKLLPLRACRVTERENIKRGTFIVLNINRRHFLQLWCENRNQISLVICTVS